MPDPIDTTDCALAAPPRYMVLGDEPSPPPVAPPPHPARDGVVIVNYCGAQDTLDCVASLVAMQPGPVPPIVVVDNASPDASLPQLRAGFDRLLGRRWREDGPDRSGQDLGNEMALVLLPTRGNGGFGAGNNVGLEYFARNGGLDYVFLLNNDTVVRKGTLHELRCAAEAQPHVDLWGCTVVDYENSECIQCVAGGRFYPWLSLSRFAGAGMSLTEALQMARPPRIDFVTGAAMYARFDRLCEVGFLNPRLFLFFEELDLMARLRAPRLGWARLAILAHKGGQSAGSRSASNPRKSTQAEWHSNRSARIYYTAHRPKLAPIALLLRFLLKLIYCANPRRWYLYPTLMQAYRDSLAVAEPAPGATSAALPPPKC